MAIKLKNNNDYVFLCANLRAREPRLLTRERMEKMCQAPSFDEAAKLLIDCDYPDMSGMDDVALEHAIAAHRKQIVSEIARFCPEPVMLDAFRIRYDYHNIKVLVKSRGEQGDNERLMSSCGIVDPARMTECYRSENYDMLPDPIRDCLRDARELLARTGDPQRTDFLIDRAYYTRLLTMTEELSDDFYHRYVRHCIDGANLRSAVRARRIGLDKAVVESAMIPGGYVAAYSLVDASAEPSSLENLFFAGIFQKAAELGAQAMQGGPLTAFESACENALTRWLDGAKYIMAGPAPVLAFLDSLDSEIVVVRTVLLGKKNGMSPEAIRERLRDSYV